jgi:hypothetical protein
MTHRSDFRVTAFSPSMASALSLNLMLVEDPTQMQVIAAAQTSKSVLMDLPERPARTADHLRAVLARGNVRVRYSRGPKSQPTGPRR